MLGTQSLISFDDDNDLFRQDTDAESDGEEQQELDHDECESVCGSVVEPSSPPPPPSAKEKDTGVVAGERRGGVVAGAEVEVRAAVEGELQSLRKEELPMKGNNNMESPLLQPPPTKGKEAVLTVPPPPPAEKRKPLTLVELPVDVLKEIVKEVNHTNDLTNLSLTCHCLHVLAIPHIYSRFDIVWPDALTPGDRTGVDALTYGLATLVAAGPRGNDYARWVKKFSLGNGPGEWVSEYNINKEGGKMLGTLVCLAITRMVSLETFSWDMPTGVLRDVFKALHDLNGRLKNVHVRFHDNTETTTPTSQDPKRRVETPTFSGFTGLRSLSVLDIDERQYLEEISYAVENSVDKLRELRLGLATHVLPPGRWIRDLDESQHDSVGVIGVPPPAVVGGVLGIVVGRIIDLEEGRHKRKSARPDLAVEVAETPAPAAVYLAGEVIAPPPLSAESSIVVVGDGGETDVGVLSTLPFNIAVVQEMGSTAPTPVLTPTSTSTPTPTPAPTPALPPLFASEPPTPSPAPRPKVKAPEPEKSTRQLKLETLELERVPISIRVLTKAIDWTCLSNLTLLNCHDHDRLWKALRTKFSPRPPSSKSYHPGPSGRSRDPCDYKMRLKKLHTDTVTPQLLYFIRDALPPNSLEVLFLQEAHSPGSVVTMDFIYRAAIRRHRGSLRKLLVDSNAGLGSEGAAKWIFEKEVLAFVSSGKMTALRELGMAIEWKNWHYFLTRLPSIPHLRSLYIHYVRGGPHITDYEAKEMAQQIVNTVILRPEIEMCYVGVLNKCFELLEDGGAAEDLADGEVPIVASAVHAVAPPSEGDEESDGDDDDVVDDGEEEEDEDDGAGGDETDTDAEVEGKEGGEEEEWKEGRGVRVRLREILFYDDKVAVFRARGGKL